MLNEIEVVSGSLSMQVCHVEFGKFSQLEMGRHIIEEGDAFNLEEEVAGFHDVEFDEVLIRGYYSGVVPFEVEYLVDGLMVRKLHKRIESAEFITDGTLLFAWGKSAPIKGMSMNLSSLSGFDCGYAHFEFEDLDNIQNRMSKLKSIVVKNPKDCEVKTCRLAGGIEEYTTYNVVNKRHDIGQVSGLISTPMGSMTLTANQKGGIRLNCSKGTLINFDLLAWVVNLIYGKVEEKNLFNSGFDQPENDSEDTDSAKDNEEPLSLGPLAPGDVQHYAEEPPPGGEDESWAECPRHGVADCNLTGEKCSRLLCDAEICCNDCAQRDCCDFVCSTIFKASQPHQAGFP